MLLKSNLLFAFVLGSLATTTTATAEGGLKLKSSVNQTVLLELFTSEGCSSCPPAETWLSSLRDQPGLWKRFIPIAFHVDYWDSLGWKDPYSKSEFSARQRRYSAQWNSSSVYTPQFIAGSTEQGSVPRTDLLEPGVNQVGVLVAEQVTTSKFKIEFPVAQSEASLEAHGALLENAIVTRILSGENSGKDLRHDFVALTLLQCTMKVSGHSQSCELDFPEAAIRRASEPSVVFWVTQRSSQRPIQAVGAPFPGVKK